MKMSLKVSLLILSLLVVLTNCVPVRPNHNQFALDNCDDTKNGIGIDWEGDDDFIEDKHYLCTTNFSVSNLKKFEPFVEEFCKTPPMGYHVCLHERIIYPEKVPIGGPHRPVWVTYGEYTYMPPQRWVHAIEHGAAVFLFNPCADPKEIDYFKSFAKSCLRRHVITPYKNLPNDELFNIVTFGCRLRLNKIFGQENQIVDYLRRHAIKDGPEFHLPDDGDYNFGLFKKAEIVSDFKDSKICPKF